MALTLDQYVNYLDTRDAPWPAPPEVAPPKAKPHLVHLPGLRAVTWGVYGTLLAIPGGELWFEHPTSGPMELALEKTIEEFKMWGSMTRKPGQPAEYFRQLYQQVLIQQRLVPTGAEKHPEVCSDRVWEALVKKLLQKDYRFDASSYGSLNEFSAKVAYFFHACLQGVAAYPGAVGALRRIHSVGLVQGLLGEGQCFTPAQLGRCLRLQDPSARMAELIHPDLRFLSHEVRARPPSEKIFRRALEAFAERDIRPEQVLHVGARLARDVAPARRLGMRTALFAGDKASLQATKKELEKPNHKPDVLLTELEQIGDVIG